MKLSEFLKAITEGSFAGTSADLRNEKFSAEGAKALALALQSGHCPAGLQLLL